MTASYTDRQKRKAFKVCLFSTANVDITSLAANHSAGDISGFFVNYIAILIVMRKGRVRPCGPTGLTCQINSVEVAYGALLQKSLYNKNVFAKALSALFWYEYNRRPDTARYTERPSESDMHAMVTCKMLNYVLYSMLDRIVTCVTAPLLFNRGKFLILPPSDN